MRKTQKIKKIIAGVSAAMITFAYVMPYTVGAVVEDEGLLLEEPSYEEIIDEEPVDEEPIIEEPVEEVNPYMGFTLYENKEMDGDLYINEGILDLNGYQLVVNGNITIGAAAQVINVNDENYIEPGMTVLQIGEGKLICNGNLTIDNYGSISMDNPNTYMDINGDFLIKSMFSGAYNLINGAIYLSGNFTQNQYVSADKSEYGEPDNFTPMEQSEIIFEGINAQKVWFDNPEDSYFNIFKTQNLNLDFDTKVNILDLQNDLNVTENMIIGDLNLGRYNLKVGGETKVEGQLNLGQGNLNSVGNITVNGTQDKYGVLNIEDGKLEAEKALTIDVFGALKMESENSNVLVKGNFTTQSFSGTSDYEYGNTFTNGTLELQGNFTQKIAKVTKGGVVESGSNNNFVPEENHKMLLSGVLEQKIAFESPNNSKINILATTHDKINFTTPVSINTLENDLSVMGNLSLYNFELNDKNINVVGNLNIVGNVVLNGGNINVSGSSVLGALNTDSVAILNIKNAKLNVKTNFTMDTYSELMMQEKGGYLLVEGDFNAKSFYGSYKDLTDGTIEVRGNFYQSVAKRLDLDGKTEFGSASNFVPTNNSKMILAGAKKQYIIFETNESSFNKLVVNKPISLGYDFGVNGTWSYLMGDVNGDKNISILDLMTVMYYLTEQNVLDEYQIVTADVNEDGKVTIIDLMKIMYFISGRTKTV